MKTYSPTYRWFNLECNHMHRVINRYNLAVANKKSQPQMRDLIPFWYTFTHQHTDFLNRNSVNYWSSIIQAFKILMQPAKISEKIHYLFKATSHMGSWDSAVGLANGYGLDDRGVRVFSPGKGKNSLFHVIQISSGAHPASYPMGTGDSFLGVKRPGREADHSPPTTEVKKTWTYTSTPHTPSWHSA
jgi:hypothetical protein